MRAIQLMVVLLLLMFSSGCSQYIEQQLLAPPTKTGIPLLTAAELKTLGIEQRQFCLLHLGGCTGYLYAAARRPTANLSQFTSAPTPQGQAYLEFDLSREHVRYQPRGTIVLVHGYGGSKQTMGQLAEYFRFLGFAVIAPDMLGHGESTAKQPGFGVQDAELFNQLIDSLPRREVPKPLWVGGMSMGATAALHLAQQRDDVKGAILFAPMINFADATLAVLEMVRPNTAQVLPEADVREGVAKALAAQQLEASQLDLATQLQQAGIPSLILASDADAAAPYQTFSSWQQERLEVVRVPERYHMLMAVPDQQMDEAIRAWLEQFD